MKLRTNYNDLLRSKSMGLRTDSWMFWKKKLIKLNYLDVQCLALSSTISGFEQFAFLIENYSLFHLKLFRENDCHNLINVLRYIFNKGIACFHQQIFAFEEQNNFLTVRINLNKKKNFWIFQFRYFLFTHFEICFIS